MDEQLRQALERAAAAEREKRAPRPSAASRARAWWVDLAAERQEEVARNWRGALQWIAEGKASRDAAMAAFLDTFGDAGLIEELTPKAVEIADTLAQQRAERQAELRAAREARQGADSETSDSPAEHEDQTREVEDDTTR